MQAGKTEIIFSRNKLFHQFSSHNIEKNTNFSFYKTLADWPQWVRLPLAGGIQLNKLEENIY